MYVLNNVCFVCLLHTDKNNLKTVLHETEDEVFTHVKYALPELTNLDSEIPAHICLSCHRKLHSFYTFKKKCLKNYNRWKNYIKTLQKNSYTQNQSQSDLQITVIFSESLEEQEQEMDVDINIKEETEDPLFLSSEIDLQTFTEPPLRIDDDRQLGTEEQEVNNTINIEDIEAIEDDSIDIKEEMDVEEKVYVIKLKIGDESKDVCQSSEEQNVQKTESEVNIDTRKESFVSENNAVQKIGKSKSEQDGGSSILSANRTKLKKVTKTNSNTNTDNELPSVCSNRIQQLCLSQDFQCPMCNTVFSDKETLDIHLINHVKNLRSLHCPICRKKFTKIFNTQNHLKSHLGIKLFQCEICHRKFGQNTKLKTHLKYHSDIRNYECVICSKKFVEKSRLKMHFKMHSGIRDYACPICKKRFVKGSHLKSHLNKQKKCRPPIQSNSYVLVPKSSVII